MEPLREQAFEMGADEVVDVEFHHGDALGQPKHLTGTAIRFRSTSASVQ